MKTIARLEKAFTPIEVQLQLPCVEETISNAERELRTGATADRCQCYGYFPALSGSAGIDTELPESEAFAWEVPYVRAGGKRLGFNFLRLSRIKQVGAAPFHLDSDAATALTGKPPHKGKLVWRLLLNLSDAHRRTLSYLDVDPDTLDLKTERGYTNYPHDVGSLAITSVVIPPRNGTEVNGVLFCSSRVLHTGKDDQYGHFVAGYGLEEPATQAASV